MRRVKLRLAGGLIVLLALVAVAAPAWSQDDTTERSKAVKKVYRDFRDDGVIEACDHTEKALQKTLDELPAEADVETPDLRPALEAAIEQVQENDCPEPTPTPSPSPAPTATAAPTSTPAPAPTTDPDDSLGSVTPPGGNDGGGGNPPSNQDVTPVDPSVTPVPPATTPAPAAPPAAEPSGPAATPVPAYRNADDAVPVSLLVLAGMIALLALLALLYAALSRLGWGEKRLAGIRRAGREARFRAGGTWGDFADWIRVGR
jgi:cobalamin biosynthesis Mg chelatase CobN